MVPFVNFIRFSNVKVFHGYNSAGKTVLSWFACSRTVDQCDWRSLFVARASFSPTLFAFLNLPFLFFFSKIACNPG